MIHDPSPKFAGAGTIPLLSEARSNLRHNQYAPSCQPPGPGAGPSQNQPSAESISREPGPHKIICWVSQVRFMTRARALGKVHQTVKCSHGPGGNPINDSAKNQCPFTL